MTLPLPCFASSSPKTMVVSTAPVTFRSKTHLKASTSRWKKSSSGRDRRLLLVAACAVDEDVDVAVLCHDGVARLFQAGAVEDVGLDGDGHRRQRR